MATKNIVLKKGDVTGVGRFPINEGKISSGYGAELLGMGLAEFLGLLKERGIPFTQYTREDWKLDKEAVAEMMKSGKKRGMK